MGRGDHLGFEYWLRAGGCSVPTSGSWLKLEMTYYLPWAEMTNLVGERAYSQGTMRETWDGGAEGEEGEGRGETTQPAPTPSLLLKLQFLQP